MRIAAALALLLAGAALVAAGLSRGDGEDAPREVAAVAAEPGLLVFRQHGCGSCHTFAPAGARGVIAPDLTARLDGRSAESIRATILAPPLGMPQDFGRRIPPADLDALAAFLAAG